MQRHLEIEIGALASPLRLQLKRQGFRLNSDAIACFQRDLDALARLRIRDVLNAAEHARAYKRLVRNIADHINAERRAGGG